MSELVFNKTTGFGNNCFFSHVICKLWCLSRNLIRIEVCKPKVMFFPLFLGWEGVPVSGTFCNKTLNGTGAVKRERPHTHLFPARQQRFILISPVIYIASIPLSNFIINYYLALVLSFVTGLVLLTCMSSGDTRDKTAENEACFHLRSNQSRPLRAPSG